MRKNVYYFILMSIAILATSQLGYAQSVAINADSSKADASAILDLKSTTKGLLVPRMNNAQRNAITAPATGLLIYQNDGITGYYYYTGAAWLPMKSSDGGGTGGGGTPGNFWALNDAGDISNTNSRNVGIGTSSPKSKFYLKTGLNTTGFTHFGAPDAGTDTVVLADKLYSSYKIFRSGFTITIPGVASFGTITKNPLQLHSGGKGWLNIIPDGSVVIGDSAGYHAFGSKLTVLAENGLKGVTVQSTDGTLVSMVAGSTISGIGTFSGGPMNIYANSAPVMTFQGTGNVGIGTVTPTNKLQIRSGSSQLNGFPFVIGSDNGQSLAIDQNSVAAQLTSTTHISLKPMLGYGYVGVNTTLPQNQFQIGVVPPSLYKNQAFAIGNQVQAMMINVNNELTAIQSSTPLLINPIGNLGIKTTAAPRNKMQVGDIPSNGYAGNDIAIGNGTNATGIAQTDTFLQLASTTNIGIMPKTGTGYVGINTVAPRAPLHVEGSVTNYQNYRYYNFAGVGDNFGGQNVVHSIYSVAAILATEFDARSDERIKIISGLSNTATDLETINKIQITDYTFKDQIANGNKHFKKVIAQQVEQVYPMVVSKHKDVVPNVYQLTTRIEKQTDGYLLTFASDHNLSKNATLLQVIMNDNSGKRHFDIVSVPTPTTVIIKSDDLKADKLFVYGEEVDDFRTVDYEGLSTLNISATQELSKKIESLESTVKTLKEIAETQSKQIQALLGKSDSEKGTGPSTAMNVISNKSLK